MNDGLSEDQGKLVRKARVAFGQVLHSNTANANEALILAMAGHAGAFADLLCAGATTGAAQALVDVTNRQLASAGYRIVPLRQ